ncbi:MAG: hypothetical protein ABW076_02630 [Candidatus Thiodiazotropha sp.]
MNENLAITCDELRELAETHMQEVEVIIEMMIEADAELCQEMA